MITSKYHRRRLLPAMLLAMLMLSCYMEAATVNPNSKEQASDCAVGRMQKPDDMLAALCDREGNQGSVEI